MADCPGASATPGGTKKEIDELWPFVYAVGADDDAAHVGRKENGGESMVTGKFQNLKVSALAFGTMRLPTVEEDDTRLDGATIGEMITLAFQHGINYFDTAWEYHEGLTESILGLCISRYPREQYFLADKYPCIPDHAGENPEKIFEGQMARCQTSYFDFYRLPDLTEESFPFLMDMDRPEIRMIREAVKDGRIRHLGFTPLCQTETMERFLTMWGQTVEFCQMPLNYIAWADERVRNHVTFLRKRGIPIFAISPLGGGRLTEISRGDEEDLKKLRPFETVPAWAYRFLQSLPGVALIISGMSSEEQVADDTQIFETETPLVPEEFAALLEVGRHLMG